MFIRDFSTFPLILSTSKYFRYVFQLSVSFYQYPNIPDTFLGDKMYNSSLELGRKRVELNVCESFKYFTKELLRKYFEKTNIFSSNICAIISGENIWNSHKHSTWPFSCLVPMKNCAFRPQKLYLEYLDADKMRYSAEKSIWNIWRQIKWEANSRNL